MSYCTQCGISLEEEISFCRRCGAPTQRSAAWQTQEFSSQWAYDQATGVQTNTGKWVAISIAGILVVGVLVSLVGVAIVGITD